MQVPLEQRPEQHSAFPAHVFPEVVHDGVPVVVPPSDEVPMAAHLPFTQVSVQQTFVPLAGHACPIETHWFATHLPLTQAPEQHSVFTVHVAFD